MARTDMTAVQFLVRARGLDPVLVSAEHALCARLGFSGRLARLGRGTLWEVASAAAEPEDLVGRVVGATGLIVNPNRHRYVWRAVGEPGAKSDWGSGGLAAGARCRAFVLVVSLESEPEDAWLAPLARAMGPGAVASVSRADLWTMDLDAAPEAAAACAAEAAVARSRRQGLLANPHFQRAVVHAGTLPPLPLWRLVDGRVR